MGELWVLKGSRQVLENVHPQGECAGEYCTIHNPAPGPWDDWPMKFLYGVVMARICSHNVPHPAVEDILTGRAYASHDCCGCPCGIGSIREEATDEP
jgi:hypothetical protein